MAYISRGKADQLFSQYIRLRDSKCVRCLSAVRFNEKRLPVSHTASHYFGRGAESTRFDPDNVDTLCYPCHTKWASQDREDYRQFKIAQLGEKKFNALLARSKTLKKKDRKLEEVIWGAMLKQLLHSPEFTG